MSTTNKKPSGDKARLKRQIARLKTRIEELEKTVLTQQTALAHHQRVEEDRVRDVLGMPSVIPASEPLGTGPRDPNSDYE